MRITVDTNLLIRAAADDDPEQAEQARDILRRAELIAVPLPALCEFVWVMRRAYHQPPAAIISALNRLISVPGVQVDHPAVAAGLTVLEAGGDFADGVITFEGRRLGGTVFVSFDRQATELIAAGGGETLLLGS